MTSSSLLYFILFFLFTQTSPTTSQDHAHDDDHANLYFSKTTLFLDYQKMLQSFKIFIYPTQQRDLNFTPSTPLSFFYNSLLSSDHHFITNDPNEAHLFFLPFPPQSSRSLVRVIQTVRTSYPYWDRSLGADHFYVSCHGVGFSSSRNVVELKKNAVQVSCFPLPAGEFIPHKDVTLPPSLTTTSTLFRTGGLLDQGRSPGDGSHSKSHLGYWRYNNDDQAHTVPELLTKLKDDQDFLLEFDPSNEAEYVERLRSSKFCLFDYNEGEVEGLSVALANGCVPVVIADRPIQDLPLMDVIKWSEIALFVGSSHGDIKSLLKRTWESGTHERMRSLGVAAAHHFVWHDTPQPYDAFYMVMYQLWLRRHAIRYARWEGDDIDKLNEQ